MNRRRNDLTTCKRSRLQVSAHVDDNDEERDEVERAADEVQMHKFCDDDNDEVVPRRAAARRYVGWLLRRVAVWP